MAFLRHPIVIGIFVLLLFFLLLSWYWSDEPDFMTLDEPASADARPVVGVATTEMLIKSAAE